MLLYYVILYSFHSVECTECLPDIHIIDRSLICGHLMLAIVTHYERKKACKALNFLVVVDPQVPNSGLATRYPCDVSLISLTVVLTRQVVTKPLMKFFVAKKMEVNLSHVDLAIKKLTDEESEIFRILLSSFLEQSKANAKCDLSDQLNESLDQKKLSFTTILVGSAKLTQQIAFKVLRSENKQLISDMIKRADSVLRAILLIQGYNTGDNSLVRDVLEAGPIDASHIDLNDVITSSVYLSHHEYIIKLIKLGACPNGLSLVSGTNTISTLFKAQHISLKGKVS